MGTLSLRWIRMGLRVHRLTSLPSPVWLGLAPLRVRTPLLGALSLGQRAIMSTKPCQLRRARFQQVRSLGSLEMWLDERSSKPILESLQTSLRLHRLYKAPSLVGL